MWSTCRRRWLWQYGLRLSPVSTPRPLWWGSLMHAALAAWYRGMQVLGGQPSVALMRLILHGPRAAGWDDLSMFPADGAQATSALLGLPTGPDGLATGVLTAARADTLKVMAQANGADGVASFTEEELAETLALADDVATRYAREWCRDGDEWEVLSVEAAHAAPLPTRTGALSVGKTYRGRVDLTVRGRGDGRLRIVEHKTVGDRDFGGFVARLAVDVQPRAYAWLLGTAGEPPISVLYNLIRKAVPAVPRLVQCRRLHRGLTVPCAGCGTLTGRYDAPRTVTVGGEVHTFAAGEPARAVSTDRGIDTERGAYASAVQAVGGNVALDDDYSRVVDSLVGNRFFYREEKFLSPAELHEFAWEAYSAACDLSRARRLLPEGLPGDRPLPVRLATQFLRSESACQAPGRSCPYQCLCVCDTPEARRDFRVRPVRHEELDGNGGR
jgi:hypothetical protein